MPVSVTIYTKPGCHLCEDVERAVDDVRRSLPFHLTRVDVASDPAAMAEYGFDIPVVAIDGKVHSTYYLNAALFEKAIRKEIENHTHTS